VPEDEAAPTMIMITIFFSEREKEFVIDNLLVRIHLLIEMILVDRPRAMGV
jgi:hypothetical protein